MIRQMKGTRKIAHWCETNKFSRFTGLTKEQIVMPRVVSIDKLVSQTGAIWHGRLNSASCTFGSDKHCRRSWQEFWCGFWEISIHESRVDKRVGDLNWDHWWLGLLLIVNGNPGQVKRNLEDAYEFHKDFARSLTALGDRFPASHWDLGLSMKHTIGNWMATIGVLRFKAHRL